MNQNITCLNCGGVIKDDKRFCGFCGAKLPEQEIKAQPQQQQQQQVVIVQQQPQQFVAVAPKGESNNLAVAAMVFAILGVLVIPGIGGLLALILGFIGAFNPHKRVMCIVSAIIGAVSLIGYSIFLWWLLFVPW